MNARNQQKQILFDVPIWMYDAVNTFVVNSGMTKKGLMQKLIKDFIHSHHKEFKKIFDASDTNQKGIGVCL